MLLLLLLLLGIIIGPSIRLHVEGHGVVLRRPMLLLRRLLRHVGLEIGMV